MPKYVINTIGNIVNENNSIIDFNKVTKEINELPNKLNKTGSTNKFFEMDQGGGLVISDNLFNNSNGEISKYPLNNVVNTTNKLNNNSFGFLSNDFEKRETTYYNSYNSVFDLDLDNFNSDNFANTQIFAENIDFYGFPLIATNPVELFGDEIPVKFFTLIDTILASVIPIATITTLQVILQNSSNSAVLLGGGEPIKDNSEIYTLGSYVRYEKSTSGFDLFYDIAKITLNSFERLMNYPRFIMPAVDPTLNFFQRTKETLLNILKFVGLNIVYFVQGYIFYLNPGLKTNISLNRETLDISNILELISTFITTNSSRHIYNLLLRKIIRNNYFLNKIVNNDAKKSTGNIESNLNSSLIYLSGFFFRFVGERVAIGEKLMSTDESIIANKKDFFMSRERRNLIATVQGSSEKRFLPKKPALSFMNLISEAVNPENIKSYKSAYTDNKKKLKTSSIYRISKKSLDEIESIIEQDYIPFSLHDLRTNEVLKFHAFIDSISDSYSANYNEMGGFGRLEKIKTYSNTTRSINVSFKLAAMSFEDHSEMWYAINKIVSMLYPQWSRGVAARNFFSDDIRSTISSDKKAVDAVTNKLVEIKNLYKIPFSQIPSNSPMIRLRIGDLITSNYSKYQAAKLFGFEPKLYNANAAVYGKIDVNDMIKAIKKLINEYYGGANYNEIVNKYKKDYSDDQAIKLFGNLVIASRNDRICNVNFIDTRDKKSNFIEFGNSNININITFSKIDQRDNYKFKVTINNNSIIDQSKFYFEVNFLKNEFEIQKSQMGTKKTKTVKGFYFEKDSKGNQLFTSENITVDSEIFRKNILADAKVARDLQETEGREIILENGKFVLNLKDNEKNVTYGSSSGNINANIIFPSTKSKDNKTITYKIAKYELKDINIEVQDTEDISSQFASPFVQDISNYENNKKIILNHITALLISASEVQNQEKAQQATQVTKLQDKLDLQEKFLKSEIEDPVGTTKINNPIIKAFESNMGKGLAGFITSFNIDWDQSVWEINPKNRAPKIVTITLGFSPSHDIPLGLDHRGNLRSIAYAVGSGASINRGLYMQESNFNYDDNQFKDKEK